MTIIATITLMANGNEPSPYKIPAEVATAQTVAGARAKVEAVAREVAAITGQSLQIPGALTKARESRRQRPANDNRQRRGAA